MFRCCDLLCLCCGSAELALLFFAFPPKLWVSVVVGFFLHLIYKLLQNCTIFQGEGVCLLRDTRKWTTDNPNNKKKRERRQPSLAHPPIDITTDCRPASRESQPVRCPCDVPSRPCPPRPVLPGPLSPVPIPSRPVPPCRPPCRYPPRYLSSGEEELDVSRTQVAPVLLPQRPVALFGLLKRHPGLPRAIARLIPSQLGNTRSQQHGDIGGGRVIQEDVCTWTDSGMMS